MVQNLLLINVSTLYTVELIYSFIMYFDVFSFHFMRFGAPFSRTLSKSIDFSNWYFTLSWHYIMCIIQCCTYCWKWMYFNWNSITHSCSVDPMFKCFRIETRFFRLFVCLQKQLLNFHFNFHSIRSNWIFRCSMAFLLLSLACKKWAGKLKTWNRDDWEKSVWN